MAYERNARRNDVWNEMLDRAAASTLQNAWTQRLRQGRGNTAQPMRGNVNNPGDTPVVPPVVTPPYDNTGGVEIPVQKPWGPNAKIEPPVVTPPYQPPVGDAMQPMTCPTNSVWNPETQQCEFSGNAAPDPGFPPEHLPGWPGGGFGGFPWWLFGGGGTGGTGGGTPWYHQVTPWNDEWLADQFSQDPSNSFIENLTPWNDEWLADTVSGWMPWNW